MAPTAAAIARAISPHPACVIATHVNPEGDAIGSLVALTLGLRALGKTVYPVLAEPAPALYSFLPGIELLSTDLPDPLPDLAIAVDCDGSGRLGRLEAPLLARPVVIDIDHHVSGNTFGTHRWVDPRASAAGELVDRLLRALGVTITPDIATNLYTAIFTDTGRFSYSNTTPRALRAAARLVAEGAFPPTIFRPLYETKSLGALRLLGHALVRLELAAGGRLAWSALSRDDFGAAGANGDDTDGIINSIRATKGVEMGLLFTEQPDGTVRVNIRTSGRVSAAGLAGQFGGGGHPRAAGCTLPGPLKEAAARVLAAAETALAEADRAVAGH